MLSTVNVASSSPYLAIYIYFLSILLNRTKCCFSTNSEGRARFECFLEFDLILEFFFIFSCRKLVVGFYFQKSLLNLLVLR